MCLYNSLYRQRRYHGSYLRIIPTTYRRIVPRLPSPFIPFDDRHTHTAGLAWIARGETSGLPHRYTSTCLLKSCLPGRLALGEWGSWYFGVRTNVGCSTGRGRDGSGSELSGGYGVMRGWGYGRGTGGGVNKWGDVGVNTGCVVVGCRR